MPKLKPVIRIEDSAYFESVTAASKEVGASAAAASNCCKGKMLSLGGYHWRYAKEDEIAAGKCLHETPIPHVSHGNAKPVIRIDDGAYFGSAIEAKNVTDIDSGNIKRCCCGYSHTAGGYHWRYAEQDEIAAGKCLHETPFSHVSHRSARPVIRIEDGTYFKSIQAAAKSAHSDGSAVRKCCMGFGATASGFHWRFAEEDEIVAGKCLHETPIPHVSRSNAKPVIRIEDSAYFESTIEAKNVTDIDSSNIRRCCCGYSHTAGGYHWRYAEQDEIYAGRCLHETPISHGWSESNKSVIRVEDIKVADEDGDKLLETLFARKVDRLESKGLGRKTAAETIAEDLVSLIEDAIR